MKIKMLFPLFALFAFSCDQEVAISNENITGSWHAVAVESNIPNVPADVLEAGEQEILSSVYELKEDFSMSLHSDFYKMGANGYWEINPDSKAISMIYSYDTAQGNENYMITYLSGKKMILKQDILANEFKGTLELTLEK